MSSTSAEEEKALAAYKEFFSEIQIFMKGWAEFFLTEDKLIKGIPPSVHSVRFRMKDPEHLLDKIRRKNKEKNIKIDDANLFQIITDLAGVRVIHLHMDQFPKIHNSIMRRIELFKQFLVEEPMAYTWDPENFKIFEDNNVKVKKKESSYTSVHYTVRPFDGSFISCEIQVRTLFEEAWGEIEHAINYPHPTDNAPCLEQIAVLAKLVGAGTRLADSIFRTHNARIQESAVE